MLLNKIRAVEVKLTPFLTRGSSRVRMTKEFSKAVECELAPLSSCGHSRPSIPMNYLELQGL